MTIPTISTTKRNLAAHLYGTHYLLQLPPKLQQAAARAHDTFAWVQMFCLLRSKIKDMLCEDMKDFFVLNPIRNDPECASCQRAKFLDSAQLTKARCSISQPVLAFK
jgi:hypothetical protein